MQGSSIEIQKSSGLKANAISSLLVSIYDYVDYRKFLSDWFKQKKIINPSFSGAVFAKKAGLSSHTLLGMVIRGDRNLTINTIRAFIRALELKGKEASFFENLVLQNQASLSEDKKYFFTNLMKLKDPDSNQFLNNIAHHAKLLSHWYIFVVREMVHIKGFKPDPDWISKKLKKAITKKEAEMALEIIQELGLVEIDKDGKWSVVHRMIDIDPGHIDFAIRQYHKDILTRAVKSIDHESIQERELSSMIMSVDIADLEEIKKRVKEFRKELNRDFKATKERNTCHVIAINTQVLTLTENEESKNEINV